MPAIEITEDDKYRQWIGLNPTGYVLNTGRDPFKGKVTIHAADCEHIRDFKSGKLAGMASRKFVADSKAELRASAKTLGFPGTAAWKTCPDCDTVR